MRAAVLGLLSGLLSVSVGAPAAAASLLPLNVQLASSSLSVREGSTVIAGPSSATSIPWTGSNGGSGSLSLSGGNSLAFDISGTLGMNVGTSLTADGSIDVDLTIPDVGTPTTALLLQPFFSASAPDGQILDQVSNGYAYTSTIAGGPISFSLSLAGTYYASSDQTVVDPSTLTTFIAGDHVTIPLDVSLAYSPAAGGGSVPRSFSSSFGLNVFYVAVPEPGSLPLLFAAGLAAVMVRRRSVCDSSATPNGFV